MPECKIYRVITTIILGELKERNLSHVIFILILSLHCQWLWNS